MSLFALRDDKLVPSARSLAIMEEEDDITEGDENRGSQEGEGGSSSEKKEKEKKKKKMRLLETIAADTDALRPDAERPESAAVLWTAVQRTGDVLVIPAYWWHQTYALEPSLSIASQRCGTGGRDLSRVFHHMLETSSESGVGDGDGGEGVVSPRIPSRVDGMNALLRAYRDGTTKATATESSSRHLVEEMFGLIFAD